MPWFIPNLSGAISAHSPSQVCIRVPAKLTNPYGGSRIPSSPVTFHQHMLRLSPSPLLRTPPPRSLSSPSRGRFPSTTNMGTLSPKDGRLLHSWDNSDFRGLTVDAIRICESSFLCRCWWTISSFHYFEPEDYKNMCTRYWKAAVLTIHNCLSYSFLMRIHKSMCTV